jgi:hypothetical protein
MATQKANSSGPKKAEEILMNEKGEPIIYGAIDKIIGKEFKQFN